MSFWKVKFSLLLSGKLLLCIFAFHPASAIVTRPLVFPSHSNEGVSGSHQVVGIITGPGSSSNDWSPSTSTWNYYLNRQCKSDNDCFPSQTLLYCISDRCQCITGGVTYLNGLFYNYNMKWSEATAQCISQVGSPCTLKQYWYSSGIVKMDCVQGHECVEITTPVAKATFAEHRISGYGSSVSVNQLNYQAPPLSYYQHLQYLGSGVASVSDDAIPVANVNAGQRGLPGPTVRSASATSTVSDPSTDSWGICVRRLNGNQDVSGTGQLSIGNANNAGAEFGLSSILSCIMLLGLSVWVLEQCRLF